MVQRLFLGLVSDENDLHCVYVVVGCKNLNLLQVDNIFVTLCYFEDFAVNKISYCCVPFPIGTILGLLLFVNNMLMGIVLCQLTIQYVWYHFH